MTNTSEIQNNASYKQVHTHGFVGLIDTMGSDSDIAKAARVSYGEGTKSVNDDRNLIRYLVRHRHTSPLEMAEVKFHIKLPIFIMRQLVRHRTANLNEYSGRYSVMTEECYVPHPHDVLPQSTTNKQGREDNDLKPEHTWEALAIIHESYAQSTGAYTRLIGQANDDFPGIARELARIVLPVSNYTECYWKCDLHNFFHFLRLRMDSHAQKEMRDYANVMYELVKPRFPIACEAFEDYQLTGVTLSRMDREAIKDLIKGQLKTANDYGMSNREFKEFSERWCNEDQNR